MTPCMTQVDGTGFSWETVFESIVRVPARNRGSVAEFVVPCYLVTHEKFPGVEFALHKSVGELDKWVLSEMSTGMLVRDGDDIAEALEEAEMVLKRMTPESLAYSIKRGHKLRAQQMTSAD